MLFERADRDLVRLARPPFMDDIGSPQLLDWTAQELERLVRLSKKRGERGRGSQALRPASRLGPSPGSAARGTAIQEVSRRIGHHYLPLLPGTSTTPSNLLSGRRCGVTSEGNAR
jgi:hypothetical protein